MSIESKDPETDCGEAVARILRALPETPLFALGNNIHYQAERSEWDDLAPAIRDFPATDPPAKGQSVVQRTLHVGVKRDEYTTVNLQLALKEHRIELACNVHSELGDRDHPNEAAIDAAKRFLEDRTEGELIAQHFLRASIDHD